MCITSCFNRERRLPHSTPRHSFSLEKCIFYFTSIPAGERVSSDGEKYKFAKLWGIQVVTPQWLYDSAAQGVL